MLIVKSIPAFNDNYIWLIHNNQGECAVVDPGDATPVLAYLKSSDYRLTTILATHHHNDHVGGIAELKQAYPDVSVIGPEQEAIAGLTQTVRAGDKLQLLGTAFNVLELPGHTLGHIGYVAEDKVFCGDVLFSGGCGRVFEGTAQQMWDSLQQLRSLPKETLVYCAHEYTRSNLDFAQAVEPNNPQLQEYCTQVNALREQDKSTLPTTIDKELKINPFLRVTEPGVISAVNNQTSDLSPLGVFTALRKWKDRF